MNSGGGLGGIGWSNGVKPVLNNKGVLDWAYVGLGVCVGWVV